MGLIEKLKINIDFRLFTYDGKRVLVFDVKSRPIGLPVQYGGVAWIYEADELKPMPEDMRRNIYEETGGDFSATICTGATVDDLDESAIENFRAMWIAKSKKKAACDTFQRAASPRLRRNYGRGLNLCRTGSVRKKSGAHKVFAAGRNHFLNTAHPKRPAPQTREKEFRVGFFACYDRIWELVNLRNDKQHYQEGFFIFDIFTFNERVVREAILNAVSHRNYQYGSSIFVRQYRDRLVVESPGGFPFGITLDNVLDRQLPRNRCIAEIFCPMRYGGALRTRHESDVRVECAGGKTPSRFHRNGRFFCDCHAERTDSR